MRGRISKKNVIAGLAVAGVLGTGIAIPAIAFAEGAEPSSSTTASPKGEAGEERREQHRDAMAEALAAELGVDKEKVAAALEKVHEQMRSEAGSRHEGRGRPDGDQTTADRQAQLKERLDQAVEDGKLTREQADAILKAAEAGVLRGPGWGGRGPK